MNSGEQVAPTVVSGLAKMKLHILGGLFILTAAYGIAYYAMQDSASFLPAASDYCPSEEPCSRPDLFAFQVSSGLALAYCGLYGFWVWHISRDAHTRIPALPEGRLFGYLEASEKLAACCFCFQIWDFAVSLAIPEHSTPIFLMHHSLAALVSYLSLKHQYLHFYGVYFLGVTEFSSVFLVIVDLARFFPPAPGTWFDLLNGICGPIFVVTFLLYRVVLWWPVSYQLWGDAMHVLKKGTAEAMRPGKSYVLYIFLAANLPLGLLQLYWSRLILHEAAKVVMELDIAY